MIQLDWCIFVYTKCDVKCTTCSTGKNQRSHKIFLHFSQSPCLNFHVFLGLPYLFPEFHSNTWVDAIWFFQYFEGAADPPHIELLMIGTCTINPSLPKRTRLTIQYILNFQGGSHFQHVYFYCTSIQKFLRSTDKCLQVPSRQNFWPER